MKKLLLIFAAIATASLVGCSSQPNRPNNNMPQSLPKSPLKMKDWQPKAIEAYQQKKDTLAFMLCANNTAFPGSCYKDVATKANPATKPRQLPLTAFGEKENKIALQQLKELDATPQPTAGNIPPPINIKPTSSTYHIAWAKKYLEAGDVAGASRICTKASNPVQCFNFAQTEYNRDKIAKLPTFADTLAESRIKKTLKPAFDYADTHDADAVFRLASLCFMPPSQKRRYEFEQDKKNGLILNEETGLKLMVKARKEGSAKAAYVLAMRKIVPFIIGLPHPAKWTEADRQKIADEAEFIKDKGLYELGDQVKDLNDAVASSKFFADNQERW